LPAAAWVCIEDAEAAETSNLIRCGMAEDHELEVLLSLDGFEFRFAHGYRVRIAANLVETTSARPRGIKYSLTLHDPAGQRIYGLDNAHGVRRSQVEFDHRHVYGRRRIVAYVYRGPIELLEDFYREVERILRERGAL
jgi:uncharacterized protein DUF6516